LRPYLMESATYVRYTRKAANRKGAKKEEPGSERVLGM